MGLSLWHVIILLVMFVLPQLPALWVIKRAGWTRWNFVLLVIPLVGLIWLYLFAFGEWKSEAAST